MGSAIHQTASACTGYAHQAGIYILYGICASGNRDHHDTNRCHETRSPHSMCTAGSYSVCAASSPKLCFRSRHRLLASTMLLVVRTERQHCACAAYRTASPQNIRCMYNDVKMQAYPGEMHAKRQFWASLPPEFVAEDVDSLRRGHGRDVNLCTGYACGTQRVRLPRLTCKIRRGQPYQPSSHAAGVPHPHTPVPA